MSNFKFGTSTVPDGEKGDWCISKFEIKSDSYGMTMHNIRAAMNGNTYLAVKPGKYKRLTHKNRGVIMSNTPMEVSTAYEAYANATGKVLITGLGMGMVLEGILSKPDVTYVRVIEKEQDVIDLVAPHFKNDPRVEIICADAYIYKPAKGERFDYAWHDIWDDICVDNLKLMSKLSRHYMHYAKVQGFWSRKEARREKRRYE